MNGFRYAFTEYTAPARWFIAMNFTVHSAMYSYYALKAMHYRVPRFVSMTITVAQLTQMVVGCAVILWAYQVSIFFRPFPLSLSLYLSSSSIDYSLESFDYFQLSSADARKRD